MEPLLGQDRWSAFMWEEMFYKAHSYLRRVEGVVFVAPGLLSIPSPFGDVAWAEGIWREIGEQCGVWLDFGEEEYVRSERLNCLASIVAEARSKISSDNREWLRHDVGWEWPSSGDPYAGRPKDATPIVAAMSAAQFCKWLDALAAFLRDAEDNNKVVYICL